MLPDAMPAQPFATTRRAGGASSGSPRCVSARTALVTVFAPIRVVIGHRVLAFSAHLGLTTLTLLREDNATDAHPASTTPSNVRRFVGLTSRAGAYLVTQRIMWGFWRPEFGMRPDGMDERWQRGGFFFGWVATHEWHGTRVAKPFHAE